MTITNNYLRPIMVNMLKNKAIRIPMLETTLVFDNKVFTPELKGFTLMLSHNILAFKHMQFHI